MMRKTRVHRPATRVVVTSGLWMVTVSIPSWLSFIPDRILPTGGLRLEGVAGDNPN